MAIDDFSSMFIVSWQTGNTVVEKWQTNMLANEIEILSSLRHNFFVHFG
jgi:hypothetical protein